MGGNASPPTSRKRPLGQGTDASCCRGRGALWYRALPSSSVPHPGYPHTASAPHAMCTVATRGSSKIINMNFFFFYASLTPMQPSALSGGMLAGTLELGYRPLSGRISPYAHCCPIYPLDVGSIKKL